MSLKDLYAGPAVGFESPMEMLGACHDRVRRTLDLMVRLEAHLGEQGATVMAREAAADVLRYFDIAGPAHHEDEERHVLPRLRASGDPALQALAERLAQDHEAMRDDWAQLRRPLVELVEGRPVTWPQALSARYVSRYLAHLAAEEGVAFPAVGERLSGADQAAMGAEMAGRRQPGKMSESGEHSA